MAVLSTLTINLIANTGEFVKNMTAAEKQTRKSAAQMQSVGRTLSVGLTLPLVAVGAASVKAASDLDESMSKANVVFGESIRIVDEFAKTSARSFGVSKQSAYEATGTFGNLFTAMGMGQDSAAGMSVDVVKLAADLASFNNLNTPEVLEKLRSGLVGEVEPLRALGVNINAAAMQAKALELGLVGADGQLSESAKIQARYALIIEQTTNAQGDFARTSEGLANSTRIAKAELTDAAAALGTNLLPMVTKAVQSATTLVEAFNALSPATKSAIVGVGGVAAAIGPMLSVGGKSLQMFNTLSSTLRVANVGMGTFALTAGAVTAAVVAVTAAVVQYQKFQQIMADGTKNVNDKWKTFFETQINEGKNAREVMDAYQKKQAEINKILDEGGIIADLFVRKQKGMLGSTEDLQTALAQVSTSADEYLSVLNDAAAGVGGLTEAETQAAMAVYESAQAQRTAQDAADAMAISTSAVNLEALTLTDTLSTSREAWDQYQGAMDMASAATVANADAMEAARIKNEELQTMSIALAAALQGDLQTAYENVTASVANGTLTQAEAEAQLAATTKEILYQQVAANLDAEAALNLARQWGLLSETDYNLAIATQKLTEAFDINKDGTITASEAAGGFYDALELVNKMAADGKFTVEELTKVLDALDGKSVTAYANVVTSNPGSISNGGAPGRSAQPIRQATGGDWMVTGPTLFLAGDAGIERATFTPRGKSMPSGGTEINIYGEFKAEAPQTIADKLRLMEMLR